VRTSPQIGPGFKHRVGPLAEGLQPVMSSAQGSEVVTRGGAVGVVGVVGDSVVEVAGACRAGAPGEDAGLVAQDDLFAESVRDLIGVHRDLLVEIDHGLDADLGVGEAAPAGDLVGGDQGAGVLDPGNATAPALAGQGCFGEMEVEDDLTRLAWLARSWGRLDRARRPRRRTPGAGSRGPGGPGSSRGGRPGGRWSRGWRVAGRRLGGRLRGRGRRSDPVRQSLCR